MGFWTKSLLMFNAFCHNTKQSIRQVAHQTGISKSSVHRLKQAMERRDTHPESWWWETEAGRCWLIRLVVATLYTFGLTRGVGAETLSEFFGRLHLETQVGCSPSALRGMMEALAVTIVQPARTLLTFCGKGWDRIWSHAAYHPDGGGGCTSASCRWCIGTLKCFAHVASDAKPSCRRPWERYEPRLSGTPSPSSWPHLCWRRGQRGQPTGSKPFSVPHRPSKGAMAICPKCITIIVDCPSSATRCGPSCITSTAELRTERRQRLVSSGGRFRISLKRCCPILRSYRGLGNEHTMWR